MEEVRVGGKSEGVWIRMMVVFSNIYCNKLTGIRCWVTVEDNEEFLKYTCTLITYVKTG